MSGRAWDVSKKLGPIRSGRRTIILDDEQHVLENKAGGALKKRHQLGLITSVDSEGARVTIIFRPPQRSYKLEFANSDDANEFTIVLRQAVEKAPVVKGPPPAAKKGAGDLHKAAEAGDLERVRALVEAGGDVNKGDKDRRTPIFKACECGHPEVVMALVEARADPNVVKKGGSTPAHVAAHNGHANVIRTLASIGASLKTRTIELGSESMMPLHVAAFNGHTEAVEALLEAGTPVDIGSEQWQMDRFHSYEIRNGRPALYLAAQNNLPDMARLLLARGANVNRGDSNDSTPLHIAAQLGHVEILKILLENGADVGARTLFGRRHTALEGAQAANQAEAVALLTAAS